MEWGNKPTDGGNLFLTQDEYKDLLQKSPDASRFIRRFLGAQEFIRGEQRYCLWIEDAERLDAKAIPELKRRIDAVAKMRSESKAAETRPAAAFPHRFRQIQSTAENYSLVVARVSSENREYLPVGLQDKGTIIGDRNFALYDAPLWNLALIASRLHWVWIGTVCVRMRTDFSYSNTLGWNTFPVPTLTEQNKADLTACAQEILLARENHFPATIADLYDPETMPDDLRRAHEKNPFEAAYSVLAKAMDEKILRQVQASISAKRVNIPRDEARELAKRALEFKTEKGRLPDINSPDAWEKRMAEGVAAFAKYRAEEKAREAEANG